MTTDRATSETFTARRRRAAVVVAALALALAGCGGSDDDGGTIPAEKADDLIAQLEAVREAAGEGDCTTAGRAAEQFGTVVDSLPATVGVETKEALRSAGDNMAVLARDPAECELAGTTGLQGTQTTPTTTATATATTTTQTTTDEEKPTPPGQGGEEPPGPADEDGGGSGGGDGTGDTGGTGGGD